MVTVKRMKMMKPLGNILIRLVLAIILILHILKQLDIDHFLIEFSSNFRLNITTL